MTEVSLFIGTVVHSESRAVPMVVELRKLIAVQNGKILSIESQDTLEAIVEKYKIPQNSIHHLPPTSFLMPGMIDTHIHAPQYPNAGLGLDLPLLDWLQRYTYPLEIKFNDPTFAKMCYEKVVRRTLQNGTTTANYFATISLTGTRILTNIVESAGQRAVIGNVCRNSLWQPNYSQSTEDALQFSETMIKEILELKCSRIKPAVVPRSALSCDEELMRGLAAQAQKYDTYIHTHMNESKAEISTIKQNFPKYATCTDIYAKCGILSTKTVLAHCVFMEEHELDKILSVGCSVAHCPNSNISLQSGLCPVRKYLDRGIKVGLATDVSGGYSVSMLDAMRSAILTSKVVQIVGNQSQSQPLSFKEAFYLATLGGAEALSMETELGNFKTGKTFDALIINPSSLTSPIDIFPGDTMEEIVEKFIMNGSEQNITHIFVDGKRLLGSNVS